MLRSGDVVAGKLRIVRQLGVGGMGIVYEAFQVHLGRRVALKLIHQQESQARDARTRFVREAQALARLPLDHIVQVLDVDTLPSGELYMVLEYLDGRDLMRELDKRGSLPVGEAVTYVRQACEGVAAAHDASIIHRDLKPQNIFVVNLEGKRRIKLLDFGIAKMQTDRVQSITGTTTAVGTPMYMSPEQLSSTAGVDHCSDIWALGVVLFELLTGRSPFQRDSTAATLAAVLVDDPPPLSEFRDDVPPGLDEIISRCLAKNPEARYADARELAAALASYGHFNGMVSISQQVPRGSSAPPPGDEARSVALANPDCLVPTNPELVTELPEADEIVASDERVALFHDEPMPAPARVPVFPTGDPPVTPVSNVPIVPVFPAIEEVATTVVSVLAPAAPVPRGDRAAGIAPSRRPRTSIPAHHRRRSVSYFLVSVGVVLLVSMVLWARSHERAPAVASIDFATGVPVASTPPSAPAGGPVASTSSVAVGVVPKFVPTVVGAPPPAPRSAATALLQTTEPTPSRPPLARPVPPPTSRPTTIGDAVPLHL